MSRSENMRRIRSTGMKPEMQVRRLLHGMGFRYRLHRYDLPGRPDIVFGKRRKIIFVHGCFWHQHGCGKSHKPQTNGGYWRPKLERNVARDSANRIALEEGGWRVLVVWECEIQDEQVLRERLGAFLA